MKLKYFLLGLLTVTIISCTKEEVEPLPKIDPVDTTVIIEPVIVAPLLFEDISFSLENAFFSTDGSMSAPVDSATAKTITEKIDITYIYHDAYMAPGFFDPVARSKSWLWNDYQATWLSNAVATKYYATELTKVHFDSAMLDESKIAVYLSDTNTIAVAPHSIFPMGSCIGGKYSYGPLSITLTMDVVFGFENTTSGKMGLMYIRKDQYMSWPYPGGDKVTKIDLIREN